MQAYNARLARPVSRVWHGPSLNRRWQLSPQRLGVIAGTRVICRRRKGTGRGFVNRITHSLIFLTSRTTRAPAATREECRRYPLRVGMTEMSTLGHDVCS
jgi:hypothetical protein